MGADSKISWTDHTFNPWIGCTRISPACDGCYAAHLMETRLGRVVWGEPGKGEGTRDRTAPANWNEPLMWDRLARGRWMADGLPTFVFCASLADVFDNAVPREWRRDLFALIRRTPHLTWLLLTKRPQLIVRQFGDVVTEGRMGFHLDHLTPFWPRNAAIGTTVEDRARLSNLGHLLAAASVLSPAFTFASFEPLLEGLGPLRQWLYRGDGRRFDGQTLGWAITGGETDQGAHKARPSNPQWFRDIRDECAAAGVAYHHKQNGEWGPDPGGASEAYHFANIGPLPRAGLGPDMKPDSLTGPHHTVYRVGKHRSGRTIDGVEHDARPVVRPPAEILI